MVIWIIGLSGAGKTTLGKEIYNLWKTTHSNTVFIDGDIIRNIFQNDISPDNYTMEGRKKNAKRICSLCQWLDSQGINVVCSILSIFKNSLEWNRTHYSKYFEVYIDSNIEFLKANRDYKGLYQSAIEGRTKNVVGIDIDFAPPENPDFVLINDKSIDALKLKAKEILSLTEQKNG